MTLFRKIVGALIMLAGLGILLTGVLVFVLGIALLPMTLGAGVALDVGASIDIILGLFFIWGGLIVSRSSPRR